MRARRIGADRPADLGGGQPDRAEVAALEQLVEHVELRQIARPHRLGGEDAGRRAAAAISSASRAEVAIGFSISTCLPAAIASSPSFACSLCGAAT